MAGSMELLSPDATETTELSLPATQEAQVGEERAEQSAQPSSDILHKLVMTGAVVVPFLGCVVAIVLLWQVGFMGWLHLSMLVGGYLLTGMGITIGFHRMLTHRSFDTSKPVRNFWMALGSLAVEGSPRFWCAVHRKHHQRSDKDGDPHSPLLHGTGWRNVIRGFVHAHTGWLFDRELCRESIKRYTPDLESDRFACSIHRYYLLWSFASLAIPALIGGLVTWSWSGALLGFVWGGLVRVFLTHHITWSINSICHIFGSQDYESADGSRNNFIFGILGHGEGWHNNHHAFPTSARHGLKWWQFDSSWLVIRGMQRVGLVWNVRTPSQSAMAAKELAN